MEVNRAQYEKMKEMNAKGRVLYNLQQQLKKNESEFAASCRELFKELFGKNVGDRPICVLSRARLGFQAEGFDIREDGAVFVKGKLYEYVFKGGTACNPKEVSFSFADLVGKTTKVFKNYLDWTDSLKGGLPIKEDLNVAQENLKAAEERLRDSKETIYSIIETWIKDFYKVEIKRGTVILFHPTPGCEEVFEVKDFAFDNDSGLILAKGEVIGWRNTLVIPIYDLVPRIKEVYLNMEDYKAYTLSGERK